MLSHSSPPRSPAPAVTARRHPLPISPLHEAEKIGELVLLAAVYTLIARAQSSLGVRGYRLDIALDHALPFQPVGIYPYVSFWPFLFAPFLLARTNRYYRRLVAAFACGMVGCYLTFLLFPTENVLRPTVAEGGFTRWLVRLVYDKDTLYNCFPSYHVTLSQLVAWATWELDREGRRVAGRLAWAVAIAIAASTVLVKQHYLADVVGGVLFAWVIHRVTLGRYSRRSEPGPDDRRSRAVLLVPAVAYVIGLIVLAVMYNRSAG